MDKTMKPGDIIIFEGGDNYVSKTICWLTKSTVSHAAMVYDEDTIVEMGAGGIAASRFTVNPGNTAHLMRLKDEHPAEPLIAAAKGYLDAEVKYDFPVLILLAGLLIYKEVRPTPRWQRITDTIIKAACVSLDQLLNVLIHKGKPVKMMVCSQLVYQICLDAGKDYVLQIETLLQDANTGNESSEWVICLASLAEHEEFSAKANMSAIDNEPVDLDPEQAAKELYEALTAAEETDTECRDNGLNLSGTIGGVREFLDLLEQLLEKVHIDIPVPALFITPADIYERAVNLERIADFDLQRSRT